MLETAISIFTGRPLPGFPPGPAFGPTLLIAAIDTYGGQPLVGPEDVRWDPRTLAMEITQDAGGLLGDYFDKLMANLEMLTTDHFTTSLPDFIRICNILGDEPGGDAPDWAELPEIGWALMEYTLLHGEDTEYQFHPEIAGYVRQKLIAEGVSQVPEIFAKITGKVGEWLTEPDTDAATVSDEPDMFADVYARQKEVTNQLISDLFQRVQTLFAQIAALPLSKPASLGWRQNALRELQRLFESENEDHHS